MLDMLGAEDQVTLCFAGQYLALKQGQVYQQMLANLEASGQNSSLVWWCSCVDCFIY